jgi:hypothetical protein
MPRAVDLVTGDSGEEQDRRNSRILFLIPGLHPTNVRIRIFDEQKPISLCNQSRSQGLVRRIFVAIADGDVVGDVIIIVDREIAEIHLKNEKAPSASQRYDGTAAIWPQMWMPVRQTSSNRYDPSSEKI